MRRSARRRGPGPGEDRYVSSTPSGTPESPRKLIGWTIAVVAAIALAVWLAVRLLDIVLLVYVSALFAMGFSVLIRFLNRHGVLTIGRHRLPRWLVVLAVYLTVLASGAALGAVVIPPLIDQARAFVADLPRLVERAQTFLVARGILKDPLTIREALQRAPFGEVDAVGTVAGALWGFLGGIVGLVTILILTF
jgi:predicted PurR-regulated permease PerM